MLGHGSDHDVFGGLFLSFFLSICAGCAVLTLQERSIEGTECIEAHLFTDLRNGFIGLRQ